MWWRKVIRWIEVLVSQKLSYKCISRPSGNHRPGYLATSLCIEVVSFQTFQRTEIHDPAIQQVLFNILGMFVAFAS